MRKVDSACSAHDVQATRPRQTCRGRRRGRTHHDAPSSRTRAAAAGDAAAKAAGIVLVHARLFLDVTPALIEQPADMLVVQPVEHEAAAAARPHEPQAAEQAQLMRHGGLARIDEFGQFADAHLLLGQRIQQADAGRIAEHRKRGGQRFGGAEAHQRPADRRDHLGGRVTHVAEIRRRLARRSDGRVRGVRRGRSVPGVRCRISVERET